MTKKVGPIIDQLKACGDGLMAAAEPHAATLVHALHAHLSHIYNDSNYLSASASGNAEIDAASEEDAVLRLEKKTGDHSLGDLLHRVGLSAQATRKYHVVEIDKKLEAAGLKGHMATNAKLRLLRAGLVAMTA